MNQRLTASCCCCTLFQSICLFAVKEEYFISALGFFRLCAAWSVVGCRVEGRLKAQGRRQNKKSEAVKSALKIEVTSKIKASWLFASYLVIRACSTLKGNH